MRSNRRRLFLPVAAVTLASLATWPRPAASDPPATQPATARSNSPQAAATPAEPVVGPIAYYIDKCARCHGDISASYLGLANPKRGKELEQIIDEMAVGPAQAPLDAEGLKQQTALHEAMFGKTPFVWIDPTPGPRVTGELLPGGTLTFRPTSGPDEAVTVTDNRFDIPRKPGTLVAKTGDQLIKRDIR